MTPVRCIACDSLGNHGEKRVGGERELNRVHMSPKARVSPGRESACISGVHPYADPHWYDNIYILHIRSGPYTRIANSPLLAFGHQCVWLTLLVAPLTPDYISICIHSRTSLSPPARLRIVRSRSNSSLSTFLSASTIGQRFSSSLSRARVIFLHAKCKCDRRRSFGIKDKSFFSDFIWQLDAICYAFRGCEYFDNYSLTITLRRIEESLEIWELYLWLIFVSFARAFITKLREWWPF